MQALRLLVMIVVFLVLFAGGTGAVKADELSALFVRVLQAPGDVALNLRYARLAEAAGRSRHALGAYERVLAVDPANSEALAALARLRALFEPAVTRIKASLGVDYESNPRNLPKGVGPRDDGTLNGAFAVFDQRALFGGVWRSRVDGYGEFHSDIEDLDYGRIQAFSGPVLELPGSARLYLAPGFGSAMLDGRLFYIEPGVYAGIERLWPGVIDAVTLRATYRDVARRFRTRDGVKVDLTVRTTRRDVLTRGDAVHFMPHLRMREAANGLTGAGGAPNILLPGDYVGIGASLYYFLPLAQDVTWGLNFTSTYRDFGHRVRFGTKGRNDWFVASGAELLFSNVACTGCDLKVRYRYEQNYSNDWTERYRTHNAGLRAIRRF